ncbi:hypothetical protein CKM354_000937000 [Cercospora kikuchii]|uniref:Uncharacterized protein n=1 Tax=Cercospora kikuchii TaxID=84275 RepID=A0A9P3CRI0_9PEZI|nr:uncharacterized protein CKM354_000937000 [Cercospora kikuchii]GIZ46237.1 hypothetical protein CKM354_000937000 [Cercospora kikuchii]
MGPNGSPSSSGPDEHLATSSFAPSSARSCSALRSSTVYGLSIFDKVHPRGSFRPDQSQAWVHPPLPQYSISSDATQPVDSAAVNAQVPAVQTQSKAKEQVRSTFAGFTADFLDEPDLIKKAVDSLQRHQVRKVAPPAAPGGALPLVPFVAQKAQRSNRGLIPGSSERPAARSSATFEDASAAPSTAHLHPRTKVSRPASGTSGSAARKGISTGFQQDPSTPSRQPSLGSLVGSSHQSNLRSAGLHPMSPDPNHGSRGSAVSPPATNDDMNDNSYPGENTIDTLDADADDFIVKVPPW